MRQGQIDGTPQPTAVRKGRRGPHPKPASQKPTRFARVPIYRWDVEPMERLKAANPGKSEAEILRTLIREGAAAVPDSALPVDQEQLPV